MSFFTTSKRLRNSVIGVALAGTLIVFLILLHSAPAVSFDASMGLLTLQSMTRGAAYNHIQLASPQDLSQTQEIFWAAHTPGQYQIPYAISKVLASSIGDSLAITSSLCIVIGVVGYYWLYVSMFGFSPFIAILCCGLIVLRRESLYFLLSYSGGPVLAFMAFPYLVASCLTCYARGGYYLLLIPALFLLGAYLKLSFVLVSAAVLCASLWLLVGVVGSPSPGRALLRRAVAQVCAFSASYLVLYIAHTSRGWTTAHPGAGSSLWHFLFFLQYSLAAVVSAATSLFWSLARAGGPFHFLLPSDYINVSFLWNLALLAMTLTSIWLLHRIYRHKRDGIKPEYIVTLMSMAVVHVFLCTLLFLGGTLFAEDRHMWPVASLLLPGLLLVLSSEGSRIIRWLIVTVLLLQGIYGLSSYFVGRQRLSTAGYSQALNVRFPGSSQSLIQILERLDRDGAITKQTVVLSEPQLALLLQHSAVFMATDSNRVWVETLSHKLPHKNGRLIVVIHNDLLRKASLETIQGNFDTGKPWQTEVAGEHTVTCAGCIQRELSEYSH